jgi:hypothetical protein
MNEENGETPAFFCSESVRDAQQTGFKKVEVFDSAAEAGLITQSEADSARLRHGHTGAAAVGYTYQNYGMDALRRGSRNDQTGLEKIIGPDSPADPDHAHEVIAQMAANRQGTPHA